MRQPAYCVDAVANPSDYALAELCMGTFKTECYEETPAMQVQTRLKGFENIESLHLKAASRRLGLRIIRAI